MTTHEVKLLNVLGKLPEGEKRKYKHFPEVTVHGSTIHLRSQQSHVLRAQRFRTEQVEKYREIVVVTRNKIKETIKKCESTYHKTVLEHDLVLLQKRLADAQQQLDRITG